MDRDLQKVLKESPNIVNAPSEAEARTLQSNADFL
jgi:hypothetical protein